MQIDFHQIKSDADPDWTVWNSIYLDSFPESERMSEGYFLKAFEMRGKHVISIRLDGLPAGLIYYEEAQEARAAYLWYLAIDRNHRGSGIGSRAYTELCSRLHRFDLMVFEVEIPGPAHGGQDAQRVAEKRIEWYRGLGARLVEGIEYSQTVDTGAPPTQMHLMAHTFVPMDAAEVYTRIQSVFEDEVRRIGELRLT